MSWDTASRVCGVCCRLCSNNSLAPLAPCPAPASSTTPDRRLTCMDSWHGYWPKQIRSLVLKYATILSQICVYKHTLTGKLPGPEVAPTLGNCCSCFTDSQRMWVTFLQSQSLNCMESSAPQIAYSAAELRDAQDDKLSCKCNQFKMGQFQNFCLLLDCLCNWDSSLLNTTNKSKCHAVIDYSSWTNLALHCACPRVSCKVCSALMFW